jgi:hypothetical protein
MTTEKQKCPSHLPGVLRSQRAHRHKNIQMGKMEMKKVIALTRMMTMKERGPSKHSMRKITLDIHLMPVIT